MKEKVDCENCRYVVEKNWRDNPPEKKEGKMKKTRINALKVPSLNSYGTSYGEDILIFPIVEKTRSELEAIAEKVGENFPRNCFFDPSLDPSDEGSIPQDDLSDLWNQKRFFTVSSFEEAVKFYKGEEEKI